MTDLVEKARLMSTKAAAVIDSAKPHQKKFVERYLCLYNANMHQICDDKKLQHLGAFSLAGMGMGLKQRFEKKFGYFCQQHEPVRN